MSVFGGSGFLGSGICRDLMDQDFQVDCIVRKSSDLSRVKLGRNVVIHKLDHSDWEGYLRSSLPDVVIAANWSGVRRSMRSDQVLQTSSAEKVLYLGRITIELGIKKFIAFGSQAEGNPQIGEFKESFYSGGKGIYGQVKARLGNNLQSIFSESTSEFTWVRPFSIFGPADSEEALISQMYDAASRNSPFTILNSKMKWSSLYISDFASAVRTLLGSERTINVMNVGNPIFTTVGEFAKMIEAELLKYFPNWKGISEQIPGEERGYIPNTSTLSSLGWQPVKSVEAGIAETLAWTHKNHVTRNPIQLARND